jgi:hypothetical protein
MTCFFDEMGPFMSGLYVIKNATFRDTFARTPARTPFVCKRTGNGCEIPLLWFRVLASGLAVS